MKAQAHLPRLTSASFTREALASSFSTLPPGPSLLEALHGKHIVASGSTGFFGLWLHSALAFLRESGCQTSLTRLSRDPGAFEAAHPEQARLPEARWLQADERFFSRAKTGPFDFALHMATSSDAQTNKALGPSELLSGALSGTSGMLDLCERHGARMLMASSGAVYGPRGERLGPSKESDPLPSASGSPDPKQFYGAAKRACERLCAERSASVPCVIARPFAFMGPWLPLETHFAAGNFLRDASQGRSIAILGDGAPTRSYMHPSDLIFWLLWLMVFGRAGEAVNVGSPHALSLSELADRVALRAGAPKPRVLGSRSQEASPDYYVPDIARARGYGLQSAHSLDEAIASSLAWLRASSAYSWESLP